MSRLDAPVFLCRRRVYGGSCKAILWQGFQKMSCIFRGRCSTLAVSILLLRGRRIILDVSCSVFL